MNELATTLASSLELGEILRIVLDRIRTLTHAEALSLLLYDRERDELVFAATETLQRSTTTGPPGAGSQEPPEPGKVLAAPLTRAGRRIGLVEVRERYGGGVFDETDRRRLEEVVARLAAEIDPETLPRDAAALRRTLSAVVAAVPSRAAALAMFDRDGHELVFRGSQAMRSGLIDGTRLSCGQGIAGWVARHREAVRLDDAASDPRHDVTLGTATGLAAQSMLCVPMVSKGELRGVIQVINKIGGEGFTGSELRLVQTLADHAAIAIENASLYRQVYLASITDDLTGLGNTRWFNQRLPEVLSQAGPHSLLVIDLDNFKPVVDTYGHLAGSRTIAEIGKRVGGMLQPGDVAARFGGDEFVVLLPGAGVEEAKALAERIRVTISESRTIDGEVDISGVTASIGLATVPDHATDAEGVFRAADEAMYAVKRGPKNAVATAPKEGKPRMNADK